MRGAEMEGGDAIGGRAGLSFAAQADHQVRADVVSRSGTFGIRWAAIGRSRQEGLHANGSHPALKTAFQVPQYVCFADRPILTGADPTVARPPAAWIDYDPLAGKFGPRSAHQLLFANRVRRAATDP